jgi:hypothetical protein
MKSKFVFLVIASIILTLCFCSTSNAQTESQDFKRNGVYTEVYTIQHAFSSGWVSLNYERHLGKKNNMMLRLGAYPDFRTTVCFPLTFTAITHAKSKHHFEYGIGFVFRLEFYEGNIYKDVTAAMMPLMYRYQSDKGLFLRAGVNVFYSWPSLVSPSFSVGWSF